MVSYNMTTKTNVTIPNTSNPCEATVFPLISAAPLGIQIEISAPPSNKRRTFKCGAY